MEIKKSLEADLENEKSSFVLLGLLIALCAVFISLEYVQRDLNPITKADAINVTNIEDDLPPTSVQETTPPPPPAPEQEPLIKEPSNVWTRADDAGKNVFQDPEDNPIQEPTHTIANTPAPTVEPITDDPTIYVKVQEPAQYPGGKAALIKFLSDNMVYPRSAMETGTQGKVMVEFVIEKDGSLSNVSVARSIDPALDREAVRVVKLMGNWIPAKNGTKKVRCKFRLPVTFQLQ